MDANFSYQSLSNHLERLEEVKELISSSLNYEKNQFVERDFQSVFDENLFQYNYLMFKDNNVIAHAAIRFREVLLEDESIPVALIGAVVVHDNFRGQGIMSKLLNYVLEKHQEKVAFFLLWSNLLPFYQRFHFYPCFWQLEVTSQKKSPLQKKFHHKELSSFTKEGKEKIINQYNHLSKQMMILKREERDWDYFFHAQSSHLYVHQEDESCYFVAHKGQDLHNIIHEHSFHQLFWDSFLRGERNEMTLFTPYRQRTNARLSPHKNYLRLNESFMALMRPGASALFSQFLASYSDDQLKNISLKESEHQELEITFSFRGNKHCDSLEFFLADCFGPNTHEDFASFYRSFYLPGLESI